jgi:hypothetical protein
MTPGIDRCTHFFFCRKQKNKLRIENKNGQGEG